MPPVEKSPVSSTPSETGNRAVNGFLPMSKDASPVAPTNMAMGGDRRGGSANLTGTASPVRAPDHRFQLTDAQMPQPAAATSPGQGLVPVIPGAAPMAGSDMRRGG